MKFSIDIKLMKLKIKELEYKILFKLYDSNSMYVDD